LPNAGTTLHTGRPIAVIDKGRVARTVGTTTSWTSAARCTGVLSGPGDDVEGIAW